MQSKQSTINIILPCLMAFKHFRLYHLYLATSTFPSAVECYNEVWTITSWRARGPRRPLGKNNLLPSQINHDTRVKLFDPLRHSNDRGTENVTAAQISRVLRLQFLTLKPRIILCFCSQNDANCLLNSTLEFYTGTSCFGLVLLCQ